MEFKLNYFFFLLLIGGLFSISACDSEEEENTDETELTEELSIDKIPEEYVMQDYLVPSELNYNRQSGDFIYAKFHPIGWSQTGTFAYIVEPADQATGFYLFEFILVDSNTDKVLWTWKPEETEEGSIDLIWETNYELFKSYLNEYEIYQQKNIQLEATNFSYLDNQYSIQLETKTQEEPDYGFDVITETYIRLQSTSLGEKNVYANVEKDYSQILSVIIAGCLRNPLGDQIAIFTRYEMWGYEGPPNLIYFQIFGSSLSSGFENKPAS